MGSQVQLRVTLLGEGAVGKTSLRRRFLGKGFQTSHAMTIGADFAVMEMEVLNYKTVFQIWDLAGQDTFKSVRSRFFKGSLGGVCVFDLTRRDSFVNVSKWIEELWRHNGKGVVPIILVGNKSDLKGERKVKFKEGEQYARAITERTQQHGFTVEYIETSAKEGENVQEAFKLLGEKIITTIFKLPT